MKKIIIALALLMSVAASAQSEAGNLMFWGNGERLKSEEVIKLRQLHPVLQKKLGELSAVTQGGDVKKMISEISDLYDDKDVYISVSNSRGQFDSVRLSIDIGRPYKVRRLSQLVTIYKSSITATEKWDVSQSKVRITLLKIIKSRKAELAKEEAKRNEDTRKAIILLMMDNQNKIYNNRK